MKRKKLYHTRFMLAENLISPIDFAEEGRVQQWHIPVSELDARVYAHSFLVDTSGTVALRLQGDKDKQNRHRLNVDIDVQLRLCCQRCLNAMPYVLAEKSQIILAKNEDEADAFAEDEVDVLLVAETLDIRQLAEEQILMALPLSPKHEDCGEADLTRHQDQTDNPFSVLANIKPN